MVVVVGGGVEEGKCRSCGLTWIEVFDAGLVSFSLQLLPSDGFRLLHLDLHLTEEKRRKTREEKKGVNDS